MWRPGNVFLSFQIDTSIDLLRRAPAILPSVRPPAGQSFRPSFRRLAAMAPSSFPLAAASAAAAAFFLLLALSSSAAASLLPYAACASANSSSLPFCDRRLPVDRRISDLISRLTLPEKISQLVDGASSVPRLGIPAYEWWSEALHGVSDVGPGTHFSAPLAATSADGTANSSSDHFIPGAVSFPQVILTAASFNASLWTSIGQVVSTEARAMYSLGQAGLTYWSPNVNIYRDPRWGRGQETPGEDPFLASRYAVSYVRGLQDADGLPAAPYGNDTLKIAACCKHYTAYDLDNWHGVDRFHFNARVTQQDLDDTYQPPFQSCVEEGNVACVMCSYNRVNGVPTCADKNLLKGTIRGKWGLNGYIASDCDSVDVLFNSINFTTTAEDAAAITIDAGLNMDCGQFLGKYTEGAVRNRKVNESAVDESLTELFRVLIRLGFFDGNPTSQAFGKLGPSDVCTAEHKELAAEAARQGIVLLKNQDGALPLSRSAVKTLAVIGPNANVTATMIGNYAGVPCNYVTPLEGLAEKVQRVRYAAGCSDVACANNTDILAEAVSAATEADAVVLVIGLDQTQEREMVDRTTLVLPGLQQALVTDIASVAKGPVILAIMSGGPIDVSFAVNSPNIAGIVWVGYPGQEGGRAIADVIFGDYNPSGKLPNTWYLDGYTSIDYTDMRIRADPNTGYPGRTYRFYTGPTLFPFGYGLSYTEFTHTIRSGAGTTFKLNATNSLGRRHLVESAGGAAAQFVNVDSLSCGKLNVDLEVEVANGGNRTGSDVVLVFWNPPAEAVAHGAPVRQLVAFERVSEIKPGQTEKVALSLNVCKQLSFPHNVTADRVVPTGEHTLVVGNAVYRIGLS